ncbi:glutaredoxin-like protein NrdH [Rothia sp. P6271]|uniref:glutaredoxin-like protein NrdH n=1 Tax=unclassified Rothia (in: high G+C Gram-positive bacteria) TaxID=2689056 RepID=UPI003AD69D25
MSVTVYTKPACMQCNMTYRALEKNGIEYNIVDITENEQALEDIKKLGYLQAPVVIAGDQHWSGFRPDLISSLSA